MKAMILAAGLGSRLRPLTDTIPKPLLTIGGTSIIVRNLLMLRASEIYEVIINLHHLGHLIEKALGDGSQWDMRIRYSHEPELLGTGGGLKAAEWFFADEPFAVMNGDTLIDLDIKDLIGFHRTHGGVATLVLREDPYALQWGAVETDAQNRILRINGRGMTRMDSHGAPVVRMFAGVHILHPSVIQHAPSGTPFSIIDTYTNELARNSRLYGFIHKGYWSDIGTVKRYASAQTDAEDGLLPIFSRMGD